MVVRSFRRVFELERRIYRLDTLRLNPGGVPVRVLVYFAGLALTSALVARLPVAGLPLSLLPWYLRDLGVPAAGAAVMAVIQVDGRPGHLAALAIVRGRVGHRHLAGGRRGGRPRGAWWPDDLVLLADGTEAGVRGLRYAGPGAASIGVEHRRRLTVGGGVASGARAVVRVGALERTTRGRRLVVLPRGGRLELGRRAAAPGS